MLRFYVSGVFTMRGSLSHCLPCWYAIWILVRVMVIPLPIQLPAKVLGKTAEDGPTLWPPALLWETLRKLWAPGFGLAQHWPLWPFRK